VLMIGDDRPPQVRQIGTTGKISLYQKTKSPAHLCVSRPGQRGVRTSRTWDGDAVDARAALDERGRRVRQKRVVL